MGDSLAFPPFAIMELAAVIAAIVVRLIRTCVCPSYVADRIVLHLTESGIDQLSRCRAHSCQDRGLPLLAAGKQLIFCSLTASFGVAVFPVTRF